MPTRSYFRYWQFLLCLLLCATLAQAQNGFVITPPSLTFNAATVGTAVDPQSVTISTIGSPVTFSVVASSNLTGCSFINTVPSKTTTPATLGVAVNTQLMGAGTYNCFLTVSTTVQEGGFSITLPINIFVGTGSSTAGNLSASPTSINMSAVSSGGSANSTIILSNISSPTAVTYSAVTTASWLAVSPNGGSVSTSTQLTVVASAAGLSPGTYSAGVVITQTNNVTITVPVTFTVSGSATLLLQQNSSNISSLNFAYQQGGSLPASQTFSMISSDATSLSCTVSMTGGTGYLSMSPPGGSNYSTPLNLTVSVTSGAINLAAGSYSATVNFSCPGATNSFVTLPINLAVSASPLLILGTPPSAFNYQTGSSIPGNQNVTISTSSTPLTYATSVSYINGAGWLTVNNSTGTASAASPATLSLGVNPAGLSAGSYTATVFVSAAGAPNSPLSFPVTLNVNTTASLLDSPSTVSFNYEIGQAIPTSQYVTVNAVGATTTYFLAPAYTTCGAFFSLSQSSGSTGSSFLVTPIVAGVLIPQVCTGTITVTSSNNATPVTINVILNASTGAMVQASPQTLTFSGQIGSGATSSQAISLTTTSTSVNFSAYSLSGWLTVSPSTGTLPATILVYANASASGLVPGNNSGSIIITTATSSVSIPVSFVLSSLTIASSPTGLSFTQPTGATFTSTQNVTVTLNGTTTSGTYAASSTANWLTLTPTSGNLPTTLTASVNTAGLSPGVYTASINVVVTGASNSPLAIPVTLTVTQPVTLSLSATALNFQGSAGSQSPPAAQTFTVSSTGAPVPFSITTVGGSCGSWLSASPLTGTTPATISVLVSTANVSAGACDGVINVVSPGIPTIALPVKLTISGATPAITTIVNAASFAPGTVAPGEIVSILGTNLGPTTANLGSFNGSRFSTTVAGIQVTFDGIAAPITFLRNDQVNVVVPFEIAGRLQVNVQVINNGTASQPLQQRVTDVAPAIFTVGGGGTGQGSIINQNATLNNLANPAPRNSVVVVFVTGAGQLDPIGTTGGVGSVLPLQYVRALTTARIGGVTAEVLYAGAVPGSIQGLYQVNLRVPAAAPSGSVPVQVSFDNVATQGGVNMVVE